MSQPRQRPDARSSAPPEARTPGEPARTKAPRPVDARLEHAARSFAETHDERSFTVLYRAAQATVLAALRGAGVRKQDLDAVASKTWSTLWIRREAFAGSTYGQFVAFVLAIARHQAQECRRKDQRWKCSAGHLCDPGAPGVAPTDPDAGPSPEDRVMAREVLAALSPVERAVFTALAEGCTWREIAEATGLGLASVWALHAKVRERLQKAR